MDKNYIYAGIISALIFFVICFLNPALACAHCDTFDGPVVKSAQEAIKIGDVTPVLKWVKKEYENEIRKAFSRTLSVEKLGDEEKELADMYFFETLVRIHRTGEGAPYTGLKLGTAVDPAVALADKALEGGSVDQLVSVLTAAMAKGIRERFSRVLQAAKHADESVAAGREFVEAYVIFTHYVEGLHALIKDGAKHHEHQ